MDSKKLDTLIDRHRRKFPEPSVVLALASANDDFAWSGASGSASESESQPITLTSPYIAASLTKLYVAVLVMQLRDEKRLDLDTPLVDVLPFDISGLHVMGGVDRSAELTIGQALAHTTGLANYLEDSRKGIPALLPEVIAHDRAWRMDEVLERTSRLGPRFAPGAPRRAYYSDTNYQLLGAVIEHVAGSSLAEVLSQRITGPLRLETTRFADATTDDLRNVATLYHGRKALRLPHTVASAGADGGLITSASDSMRFLRALFGGELISTTTLAEMQQDWRRIFYPFTYGLGIMRFRLPRLLTGGKPVTLIGHSGVSGALAFFAVDQGMYVAGTTNQMEPRSASFKLAIRALQLASAR